MSDQPHRRWNPLTGEWVLVSPHRTQRPWLGQTEDLPGDRPPAFDPSCYLCPGNSRAGGRTNPPYGGTFVFDNDYPALLSEAPPKTGATGLLRAEPEAGVCRVICYSPRHDLGFADLERPVEVVDEWTRQYEDLGARPDIGHVQIFENRGAMMGASNPHPHGQIWATRSLPNEPWKETQRQAAHLSESGDCLLCSYLQEERAAGERLVDGNRHFTVLVPFWAVWPFEALILPHRHVGSLPELTAPERAALADAMQRLIRRYDRLFGVPFPYSMGLHQKPTDGAPHEGWHLHAHFYPPLLRSATVRKFMVGFEMLGNPQRDLTAEGAAARLREVTAP